MGSQLREQLIETAVRLFYREGFHATGVDRIIAEAGVSKMTLYKYFKSKDELILAALRRWDEEERNWLMRAVERRTSTPKERLLALCEVLDERFAEPNFCGCMFINATAEFAAPDDPVHTAAIEHKRLIRAYIRQLAVAAGARDPDELTNQIALLMEGAIVMTQCNRHSHYGAQARKAAEVLVAQACE